MLQTAASLDILKITLSISQIASVKTRGCFKDFKSTSVIS